MATTAVFAEILIVGLEAAAWLTLLILDVFGRGWIHPSNLKGWEGLATVLVLAAAYVLGILIDRFADTLWNHGIAPLLEGARRIMAPVAKRVRRMLRRVFRLKSPPKREGPTFSEMRLAVLAHDNAIAAFLEYQRSRLRVARSTVVNIAAAIPTGALYLGDETSVGSGGIAWYVGLMSVVLVLSVYTTRRIQHASDDRVREAFAIVSAHNTE